jgi:hypothetical protein
MVTKSCYTQATERCSLGNGNEGALSFHHFCFLLHFPLSLSVVRRKTTLFLLAMIITWLLIICMYIYIYIYIYININKIPFSSCASLSHLSSYTPTKSNLHPSNSLAVAVSDSDLYRLLTFQVPNLMPLFHSLDRTTVSVQVRGTCVCFVTMPVFTVRSFQHLAQPPS